MCVLPRLTQSVDHRDLPPPYPHLSREIERRALIDAAAAACACRVCMRKKRILIHHITSVYVSVPMTSQVNITTGEGGAVVGARAAPAATATVGADNRRRFIAASGGRAGACGLPTGAELDGGGRAGGSVAG